MPSEPQGAARGGRDLDRQGRLGELVAPRLADFEIFNEEWLEVFQTDGPVGQSTIMPPLQRRAGFRVSIGVIAEA